MPLDRPPVRRRPAAAARGAADGPRRQPVRPAARRGPLAAAGEGRRTRGAVRAAEEAGPPEGLARLVEVGAVGARGQAPGLGPDAQVARGDVGRPARRGRRGPAEAVEAPGAAVGDLHGAAGPAERAPGREVAPGPAPAGATAPAGPGAAVGPVAPLALAPGRRPDDAPPAHARARDPRGPRPRESRVLRRRALAHVPADSRRGWAAAGPWGLRGETETRRGDEVVCGR